MKHPFYFFNFYWCSSFKKCAFFLLAEGCPISHRAPTCLQPTNVFMWAAIWKSPSFFTFFFTTCNLDTLGLVNWIPWDGQPPTPSGCWLMARCRCSDPPNSIGGDSSWEGGMHPNRYQHWQRIKAEKICSKPSVRTVIFCLVMMINPSFTRVKMLTFLLWDAWRVVWSMQASWWNEWNNDERRWSNRRLFFCFGHNIWDVSRGWRCLSDPR